MSRQLKVAVAQLDLVVGNVHGNTDRIIAEARRARDAHAADLVVFPELSVCGYPPEDLLLHAGLRADVAEAVERLRTAVPDIAILIGFPEYTETATYNSCRVYKDGETLCHYRKRRLPNYAVFDEERYFKTGHEAAVFPLCGLQIGLTICEDIWGPEPMQGLKDAGAELAISINGSPFETRSQVNREHTARTRIAETGLPMIYANMVGGQDELVFDGGSFAMTADGEVVFRTVSFTESLDTINVRSGDDGTEIDAGRIEAIADDESRIYQALVTGTRDYVNKHGFPGVIIGLSGGIDSALVLAVACDALGADRVRAVQMPFHYTSDMSREDSAEQATLLGVGYDVIPIAPIYDATVDQLSDVFAGREEDVTEENIQSRCRGLLLMSISNKTGRMLLTTGNKSEMAVGYATLYGDMAGGFAPIKDCSKTLVYRLARYRNRMSPAIPERVITRPPSAELRPDQKDTDSLPDYDILDPILEAFIEEDLSVADIVERGFERETVIRVLEMVKRNEYKRRQAPPGVRISSRAFGRDWRYPITSQYRFPR
ncbi:MAG: NAD+ synthase [Pseudomonadota bacterium]